LKLLSDHDLNDIIYCLSALLNGEEAISTFVEFYGVSNIKLLLIHAH